MTAFCRLRHSDVFNLIYEHNLFNSIQDKIIMLMEFNKEASTLIISEKIKEIFKEWLQVLVRDLFMRLLAMFDYFAFLSLSRKR